MRILGSNVSATSAIFSAMIMQQQWNDSKAFSVAMSSSDNMNLQIKKNIVGTTEAGPLQISSIGCGTWSWGNRLLYNYDVSQDEEIYECYRYLRLSGVSLFDTADSYGTLDLNGRAEILLGSFERRLQKELTSETETNNNNVSFLDSIFGINRSSPAPPAQQVATKFAPYPWRITKTSLVNAARSSLSRLEENKLALAQLHWSTANYQPFQEQALWEGIANIYQDNLCDAVGVSNYGPKQLLKISEFLKEREVPLATSQIQYSLMTYKEAQSMNDACDETGCTLISYSPLCLGLLTAKYTLDNLPPVFNPRRQLFLELLPSATPLLQTLKAIAKEYNKTPSQVAINWTMCKKTVPIFGARTVQQAVENIGSVGWSLKPDAVDELDRMALSVKKPMIQNVFQTK